MANIHDLIAKIEDEVLRKDLEAEVKKISKQKKFGLVFEEHLPECTPLYGIDVKRGTKVARSEKINEVYTVIKLDGDNAVCVKGNSKKIESIPVSELVPIAEFGDPIYPCLQPIDTVCNAPDSDLWHTLIEADNYHALQLLEYLYAGKVDCIYIDPPYNTGAKDWKYNNDYVDSADSYRHSKWLSMMQKRLKIAKKLLNPADSVLIITIDEKEYLHLGCLLEEMFPEANIQMISSVINRKGSTRRNEFSRCVEYIYFVMIGDAVPCDNETDMIGISADYDEPVIWDEIRRRGSSIGSLRKGRPGLFYPIFIDKASNKIVEIGESPSLETDRHSIQPPRGTWAAWPLRPNGEESCWQISQSRLAEQLAEGTCYLASSDETRERAVIRYLKDGDRNKVLTGKIPVIGRDKQTGRVLFPDNAMKMSRPKDVWNVKSHDAGGSFGMGFINGIFYDRRFTFPKSIIAVHDSIRFFTRNKSNALILDFFAGSGTTLHAVNLLNAEDGGHRRCIMVTNNEVSDAEAKEMKAKGLNPGDEEWEKLGIARYVTWPRTVCSIEGHDVNGNPLKGNYIGSDIPMADGFKANAAFFKLGFLDKDAVNNGKQFKEMLPTLWMKSGAICKCPEIGEDIQKYYIFPENRFAILNKESAFAEFAQKIAEEKDIETVFFVTDYEDNFCEMKKVIGIENCYQLYKDYLDNFRINTGRTR